MKILLIDNNDSFTYNLLHLIRSVCKDGDSVEIHGSDEFTMDMDAGFGRIIFSPGPGIPSEAPILRQILQAYKSTVPILGICLGHQAIAEYYGAELVNLEKPVHGICSEIMVVADTFLFKGLGRSFYAGRYHSWCVSKEGMPDCLEITAVDDEGNVMGISHREYDIHGVQFHPESFMTECGGTIISNFLKGGEV